MADCCQDNDRTTVIYLRIGASTSYEWLILLHVKMRENVARALFSVIDKLGVRTRLEERILTVVIRLSSRWSDELSRCSQSLSHFSLS